ncbi:MAG: Smr/MutS family protein [Methylococcales bacterium]
MIHEAVPPKSIDENERQLFRNTVGKVKPLKSNKTLLRTGDKPKPVPRRRSIELHAIHDNCGHPTLHHDDSVSFIANGVRRDVIKNLRRGQYEIEADLDLHGQTAYQAKQTLLQFLQFSTRHSLRCVHIIHGKGYRSPDSYPILKNKVDGWLRQHPDVLAFCSSTLTDGGTGAIYVLLR